jgi:uncharacterized phiE125 gp8 family phage protein
MSGAPAVARDDAKAYLRLDGTAEDALIDGLIASATRLCEAFTGQVLVARAVEETVRAGTAWHRLSSAPVRAIGIVEALAADGTAETLPEGAYTADIDANGAGWVRLEQAGGAGRLRVPYEAGLANDAASVPEPLKQGIVRLVAHLYAHRDAAGDAGPPAAVAALWRPWRRMRLA